MRWVNVLAAPALALVALLAGAPGAVAVPPIKHVFVIVLENENFQETFGNNSKAPYLASTLASQGQLLANYYAIAHLSQPNYLAAVSGQPPNIETQGDCQIYSDFSGAVGSDGIAVGQGCVYPAAVKTIADQLEAKGLTWKGYMEDMANSSTQSQTCRHPAIGAQDSTQNAHIGDQYAARHNPFVYFHSLIDRGSCDANDVDLRRLQPDLASYGTTANFNFIVPNLCDDGHDAPCVDGRPGGLTTANEFLKAYVPVILGSPAYKRDGMLIVTFDEAESGPGSNADASGCCGSPAGPNTVNPGGAFVVGPGGGLIGAVVLSPWTRASSTNPTPYNHYSFLRSMEDLFGLDHLGFAAQAGLRPFGDDVYNGPGPSAATAGSGVTACTEQSLPKPTRGRYSRGKLIATAKVSTSRGVARLRLSFRHRAALDVRVSQRFRVRQPSFTAVAARTRTVTRRVGPRSVKACRTYTVTLPRGHGRIAVTASFGGGSERRGLGF